MLVSSTFPVTRNRAHAMKKHSIAPVPRPIHSMSERYREATFVAEMQQCSRARIRPIPLPL